ncbi:hypothetical protein TNCT_729491 [Trichonephila clavata]|uniref:Uncharacterized protein n=1 Tax=Trichonephila clavata TaxID=2740835 RepID=A0A8X6HEU9_TRICU|nr:hypothetical protein TNCT_729491 [Trichonephila clavata]
MISEHDEFWVLEAESGSERFIAGSDPVSCAELWWPILAAFAYELFEVIWFGVFWVWFIRGGIIWDGSPFFGTAACSMFLSALLAPSSDVTVLRTVVEVIAVITLRCSRSAVERIPSDGHIAAVANV